jgi:FKBP-type peptidyl-prolyl cis-trans isomerase 2
MVQRVPRKHFKGAKLVPGQQVVLPTPQGQRAMTIQKVGMSVVDVDLNHPMAGKTLDFDVEILEVRPATDGRDRAQARPRRRRARALMRSNPGRLPGFEAPCAKFADEWHVFG